MSTQPFYSSLHGDFTRRNEAPPDQSSHSSNKHAIDKLAAFNMLVEIVDIGMHQSSPRTENPAKGHS
jgi:hypothetical protein